MTVEKSSPSSSSPPSSSSKPALPPGMVIGPDGKPCKICTAFRNWKPPTAASGSSSTGKGQSDKTRKAAAMMAALATGTTAAATTNTTTPTTPLTRPNEPPPNCPPDVEQLGRATWTFLHTTAAYYPDKPTPNQRANMLSLIRSLPVLYPCGWCADDFGKDIMTNPPDVSNRVRLSQWLCQRHNEVNQKLGKERFDCAKVDERWKDGPPDGSCD